MCGICGIISKKRGSSESSELVSRMMQSIKHRGPDDEGKFTEDQISLGFVRLSIIDLTPLGHQPMFSADNRYNIIFNGEIYNYIELREELLTKGYRFRSKTDTEVLLYSYIEWGEDCLHKLNGMWAFAIYDNLKKELFCARDRFGVKPFYYYADNSEFIFASEIPPILTATGPGSEPDYQTIFEYLVFNRTDQTEKTFFKNIKKLQHGCSLRINLKEIKPVIKTWYLLKEKVQSAAGFKDHSEYRELFSSAVGLRLRSDVPVGVCLSGGIDSSSIVSVLLKDYSFNELNTFSAVYGKGKRGDESSFIDEYRGIVKNMHFTTPTADTLYNDLDCFIRAHSEPIPSTSPYAQYKVMEAAKNHVVVTLDGQGADEELAGYHYFFGFFFKELLNKFNLTKLISESAFYLNNHRSVYGLKTFLYFMLPETFKTKARVDEKGYLSRNFTANYSKGNTIAGELYSSGTLNEALLDHFEYKLEHLLKWEDRNSMWFSLESRVPFLDYRLVEKTLASDPGMKINKGMTKKILREAMSGTLPEKIRLRKDKIGFLTPEDEWFRGEKFRRLVTDILSSESFRDRNIIEPGKSMDLYKKHLAGEINISKEIWKWINLELWFRKFIDGKSF
jgi:asparagine synthase (glutamine-hydrolysing)